MPLQSSKVKAIADVVLCVDCTASMQSCIDGLKSELSTFIDAMESPTDQSLSAINWRLRVIGFRDLKVDADPWVGLESPMVDTIEAARDQLDHLSASGGGDHPESSLDALWFAAARTEWRDQCTKVVVLFSDAATHTELHSSTVGAGAAGNDASAVLQALVEKGIWLRAFVGRCETWESFTAPKCVFQYVEDADGLEGIDFADTLANLAVTVSQASRADGAAKTVAI